MNFPEKLDKLCALKGWSQADLVRAIGRGVSRSTVSRWFNGEKRPFHKVAPALAKVLGVSLDYLADDALDDPPVSGPSDEAKKILWLAERVGFDDAVSRLVATTGPRRRPAPEPLGEGRVIGEKEHPREEEPRRDSAGDPEGQNEGPQTPRVPRRPRR